MNILTERLIDYKTQSKYIRHFMEDVDCGLNSVPKFIPSKYFYDEKGSNLFKEITKLPEYYPTESERGILKSYSDQIISDTLVNIPANKKLNIIELGAGDSDKPYYLIDALIKTNHKFTYNAIDISPDALQDFEFNLKKKYENIDFNGIAGEYFNTLKHLEEDQSCRNLVLFLGSNIGNLDENQATKFLSHLKDCMNPGDFILIGFDLVKDMGTMISAYSDPDGITEQFNLNLLVRINKELGANFNINNFFHYATYNALKGAMESFLISKKYQKINIDLLNSNYEIEEYEAIHTEYSFKYTHKQIQELVVNCGFKITDKFLDKRNYFTNYLLTCD